MHERGARRSLAGPGALFFPPRAEPRIKQPRRGSLQALFFAPDGLLPSPSAQAARNPRRCPSRQAQNGRRCRHGVLPAQEPPRDSAVKVARFSRRRCQPICKRSRIRGRNARRHYKRDPEERTGGGGGGRKRGFLSRTRNYGPRNVGRRPPRINERGGGKKRERRAFRVSRFYGS